MINLDKLAQVVDEMILQHDYPGFEARALKLGLPESVNKGPAKVFAQALGHESVFVKLAALRWFQEKPGLARAHVNAIMGLCTDRDPFVRLECVRLMERFAEPTRDIAVAIAALLEDEDQEVSRAAARCCGKMCVKLKIKDDSVIESLKKAASHGDAQLRGKAEKALRKIGIYD